MSASDDLDKFFSALQRHKDLIIETHLDNNGFVEEKADNDKAVAELIRQGAFWRMDDAAARARLSHSFSDVLNLARRDELRRQVNLDIGERLTNLEQQIASYRKARRFGTVEEQDHAFRTQQRQGRIVRAFALKYQREPGLTPSNYAAQTQIPPILNQVEAIPLNGHADLDSSSDEILLTKLIHHLRKQPQRNRDETESERISVRNTDEVAVDQVELDALNRAVQDFYLHAAEQGTVQAMASFDLAPADCPSDIWLFAIASRHNMMSADERAVFAMEFIDTPDPFFTGQRSVSDIRVRLR